MHKDKTKFCILALLIAQLSTPALSQSTHPYEGVIKKEELAGLSDYDRGFVGLKFVHGEEQMNGPNACRILNVLPKSPAERAGIRKGDRIIAIDGVMVRNKNTNDIFRMMRGKPGSNVTLTIERNSERSDFVVQRGGLSEVRDVVFKNHLMNQDTLLDRDARVRACVGKLLVSAPNRAGTQTSDPRVLAARVKGNDLCDQARFALERMEDADAVKLLKQAVAIDPEFNDSQDLLAQLLVKLARYAEAQPILERLARSNPKSMDVLLGLADCYQSQGKVKETVETLKKTIVLTNNPDEEGKLRARIYTLMDNPASAAPPENSEVASDLQQNGMSQQVFQKLQLADALMRAKKYSEAAQKLRELVSEKSCPRVAWKMIGLCEQLQGNWASAAKAYGNFLSANDPADRSGEDIDSPALWLSLAQCQHMAGADTDAINSYRQCLTKNPSLEQETYALDNMGTLQLRQGLFIDGVDSKEKAIRANPEWAKETGMAEVVDGLRSDLKPSAFRGKDGDNYFAAFQGENLARWVKRKPLKVYIADGSNSAGFRPAFREVVRAAFAEWYSIGEGCFSYQFVDKPEGSDIECQWVDDGKELEGKARNGVTFCRTFDHKISHATIKILTLSRYKLLPPLTEDQIRTVALHEIGHSLGLAHSGNPVDVMFPMSMVTQISGRDKKTLQILYSTKMPSAPLYRSPADPGLRILH